MDNKVIGLYIKKLRNAIGITQLELANEIHVSDKTVSKWESGNGLPEIESLLKLSDFFNVTVDDILRAKSNEKEHTEILYIMDRSGSMFNITQDVIGGFNSFLESQKALSDQAFLTTILFNNKVTTLYLSRDVSSVHNLDDQVYVPSGSTSLFDAIGQSVLSLQSRTTTNKVIVVIMTDGYENSSRIFTRSKIKRLIDEKSNLGWEFIFAGANIDVDKVAEDIGIKKDHRMSFISDGEGTRDLYNRTSSITSHYRSTGEVKIEDKK